MLLIEKENGLSETDKDALAEGFRYFRQSSTWTPTEHRTGRS